MRTSPAPRATSQPQNAHEDVLDRRRWAETQSVLVEKVQAWCSEADVDADTAARSACAYLLTNLWDHTSDRRREWLPRPPASSKCDLPIGLRREIRSASAELHDASWIDVGYLAGGLYTRLLTATTRARLGAYYTPPELAERLLDLDEAEGADWASWTVLDPACGGGAFLVPVAHRILAHHQVAKLRPEARLRHLEDRLAGIEIDEFAAWKTHTLLRLLAYELSLEAGRPPDVRVEIADALVQVVGADRRWASSCNVRRPKNSDDASSRARSPQNSSKPGGEWWSRITSTFFGPIRGQST